LSNVQFPGRLAFDELLSQLAELFAVRYCDPSSDTQVKDIAELERSVAVNSTFSQFFNQHAAVLYSNCIAKLENHDMTIGYFDEALCDHSRWPNDDAADKQDFHSINVPSPNQVTKSGWSTTLFIQGSYSVIEVKEVSSDDESNDKDQYHVVGASWDPDSDEMSVDSRSPTFHLKDILP
jgi:hypothetical protein